VEQHYASERLKAKESDPETELLKQEYLKLKQTLSKLKKEPAAAADSTKKARSRSKPFDGKVQSVA